MTGYEVDADEQAAYEYQRWVTSYVWHTDQLPLLIETTSTLALPSIGVSRGGSAFDRPQVTGGGYYDSVPIRDGGATTDSRELWALMWRYLEQVHSHLPAAPTVDRDVPQDTGTARRAAYTVTAWLAENVEAISDLHDVAPVEDDLFALIRRLRGRYATAGTARRARPRTCTTCSEAAVIVDWIDGANGSPRPVQVGLCRSCGETFTEDINHANGSL
ncbi:hypothetical protein ACIPVB_09015 [Microbacterium sp. NPDC090007]|uniref:hypothetical protein n=1 Tax=Microbacterium sp. NPDC090007 TaxID=3364204 RepID=UPI0038227DCA